MLPAWGQEKPYSSDTFKMVSEAGSPMDWTHHHVVFSAASSAPELQSIAEGEPRYWLQLLRHRGSQEAFSADGENAVKIAAAQLERLNQQEELKRERDPEFPEDESLEFGAWRRW